jgi:hypothetical protein
LEHEVIKVLYPDSQGRLDVGALVKVDVDQMCGIEIEEFPALVAEVALWLTDHQMNMRLSEELGQYFKRLPLVKSANIKNANALQIEWEEVISKNTLSFILGNPPFRGTAYQSDQQKIDMRNVFDGVKSAGMFDLVSAWYIKAAKFIQNTEIEVAFVSTNSIIQGEQVGLLWQELYKYGIRINFAHQTFRWSNDAKGKAAVHCVIIGFATYDKKTKKLFTYSNINAVPHELIVSNINAYLAPAVDVVISSRSNPICQVISMKIGSALLDGGHLIFSSEEYKKIVEKYSETQKFFRRFVSGDELINNGVRYCLWLKDVDPAQYRIFPEIIDRLQKVKEFREMSQRVGTKKMAAFPTLFAEDRQPVTDFLAIPKVSSENRRYIPIAYLGKENIVTDKVFCVPGASLYHFGILTSEMHMAWMRAVCGRLESRYSYSNTIVYNNFPWPENVSDAKIKKVEECAQRVLDSRVKFPELSLAELYDSLTMPPELTKAHQELDRAVDVAYGKKDFKTEAERVAFLFEEYNKLD